MPNDRPAAHGHVQTGAPLKVMEGHMIAFRCVPTGRVIHASGSDSNVKMWNRRLVCKSTIRRTSGLVQCLAFSPDVSV